jgi:hypothetical protein
MSYFSRDQLIKIRASNLDMGERGESFSNRIIFLPFYNAIRNSRHFKYFASYFSLVSRN